MKRYIINTHTVGNLLKAHIHMGKPKIHASQNTN